MEQTTMAAAQSGTTAPATEQGVRCLKCNTVNEVDAKFCDQCGFSLQKTKACPACRELNDPNAKFCDNCGGAFTP